MDRYWLLTWTTYGTWLPGDRRRFVGKVRNDDGKKFTQNQPDMPFEESEARLENYARSNMKSRAVALNKAQARECRKQFAETAEYRNDWLIAVAIMPTHIHLLLGVPGDPDPIRLLQAYKSYSSRRLNSSVKTQTWWTRSGSKRKRATMTSLASTVAYIKNQRSPLLIYIDETFE